MAEPCVVDTCILQKANATIVDEPKLLSEFRRRLALLEGLVQGSRTVLYSAKLLKEYEEHVPEPRNDFVKLFLELVTTPGTNARPSWAGRWRAQRLQARTCRFPQHDDHLLRTAAPSAPSVVFTEEAALVAVDACIHRSLQVHLRPLPNAVLSRRLVSPAKRSR